MKVLYHHRTASKDGQDVHIEEMIAAMRRQGHDVMVVAPRGGDEATFGRDGGMVARLKTILPSALYEVLELGYSVYAYGRLKAAYESFHPDVLYERYNLFSLPGLWLKWRVGIPYLVEINAPLARERSTHGGLKLKALAYWCERAVWRGADMTFPVTEVLADWVRRAGVPENRIMVVPNGINRERFSVQSEVGQTGLKLAGKIVLGFVGFIREWHGLPTVVAAMAAMENQEQLHLVVVGDGPGRADVEECARQLTMVDNVSCVGLVARDRVASYVSAFDIALLSRVEAYASPLKLFEYMGLGRAIIAPDQPNIREVLTDGENALLFRQDDPAHFTAQIMRLCGDAGLRRRLGEGALRSIEEKGYTWDNNAKRVLAVVSP